MFSRVEEQMLTGGQDLSILGFDIHRPTSTRLVVRHRLHQAHQVHAVLEVYHQQGIGDVDRL